MNVYEYFLSQSKRSVQIRREGDVSPQKSVCYCFETKAVNEQKRREKWLFSSM